MFQRGVTAAASELASHLERGNEATPEAKPTMHSVVVP